VEGEEGEAIDLGYRTIDQVRIRGGDPLGQAAQV